MSIDRPWVRSVPFNRDDPAHRHVSPPPSDYAAALSCPVRGAPLHCGCQADRLCGVTFESVLLDQCRVCEIRPERIADDTV